MIRKYGLFVAYTLIVVIVVAAVSCGLTMLFASSGRVASNDKISITRADYEMLQRYVRIEQLRQYVQGHYVDDTTDQDLIVGAAQGLIYSLGDPYSGYFTPEQTAVMAQDDEGKYFGIGCQLIIDPEDGLITVTRVYKESPAEEAAIVPGDKIIGVFGETYAGPDMNEAVKRMRGEAGTDVDVTILRGEERLDLKLRRAEVTVNRVEMRMLEGDIGLITLYEFEGDAVEGIREAIRTLEKEKVKGMILDLRGNPGGNVEICAEICDMLLPEGKIVTIRHKNGEEKEYSSDAAMLSLPYVVLVNEYSASASEILAAAVQDYGTGKIVGMKTFGKGCVQSIYVFKEDNASLHLTTAYYYTPKKRMIHGIGVEADRKADLPKELKETPTMVTEENDTQLQAAIDELNRVFLDK